VDGTPEYSGPNLDAVAVAVKKKNDFYYTQKRIFPHEIGPYSGRIFKENKLVFFIF
jgi:hypothetical protein